MPETINNKKKEYILDFDIKSNSDVKDEADIVSIKENDIEREPNIFIEIKNTSEFTMDSIISTPGCFKFGKTTFLSMAYAVRAIKRQYTLIPLTPVKNQTRRYATASSGLKTSTHRKNTND